ncbi:hybrid sensor histidine kinase/response regulator [Prosthecobacter sp.]|uniref:hybrid sensor histidine kinase/response regulator n=1 Tax=Prosthecobacter sp. TaxID=1965333 RepID=UPI002AB8570E|nr:hybrid sensor histidine kinase/response regulator [Prosthecobacter sp.]MDZ4404023.1 hybrid sensor histidine kinase/response regulator [Prosthecobacter sp.]
MTSQQLSPYHILYVDDEEKALHYFREIFGDEYIVHTANNALDGYRILQTHGAQIGLMLTDQRMPGPSGIELMEHARKLNPNLIRVLVTAYTDYQAAVDAVNSGRCFRYIHKPWDPDELAVVIKHGLDYYHALIERERLLTEKADTVRHMLSADKVSGLGILAEGLNHHLRNALTVVRAFIDLAPMKLMEEIGGAHPRDPSFWLDVQNQAQSQIERIQSLLARLAEASHAKRVERNDKCSLNGVLSEMIDMFSEGLQEKNLHVDVEIDPNLPPLMVHDGRFRQMWRLIFMEELTHLSPGDQIQISAKIKRDAKGQSCVEMYVRDTGMWEGTDKPINLFDPFYTRSRKPDDFGVNMMACYVTMHLHGGTAEARHLEPRGLELKLTLPLDPSSEPKKEEDFFRSLLTHEQRWQQREEMVAA